MPEFDALRIARPNGTFDPRLTAASLHLSRPSGTPYKGWCRIFQESGKSKSESKSKIDTNLSAAGPKKVICDTNIGLESRILYARFAGIAGLLQRLPTMLRRLGLIIGKRNDYSA
jgi:hypothetical protein